jgi:PPOX class probable F420-dependent enzyme
MPLEINDRTRQHLTNDTIGWLTTVTPSGKPAPRPIWFLWDGSAVTIYSLNTGAKLTHIAANNQVTLHFDGRGEGNDVVVLSGTAEILADAPPPSTVPELLTKYAKLLDQLGQDTQWWDSNYGTAIRITPQRAWTIPG